MDLHRPRTIAVVAAALLAVLAPLAPTGSSSAVGGSSSAAGKPAPVKITLKPSGTGKVTSDRASCYRQVGVFAYGRLGGGELATAGMTFTDNQGRYPGGARRGGVPSKFFALVVGDDKCKVAQSDDVAISIRAGHPAKRRVSITATQTTLTGKVTSKRPGCVKHVPVQAFVRFNPTDAWTAGPIEETDGQGRYDYSDARRRGGNPQLTVVAFGDPSCSVARSPIKTVS